MPLDKDLELALKKGRPTPSKFAPPDESRLTFFRDYLASMEAFIETEIQNCYKAYEARVEKSKDEDEQYLEWQITGYELEQLERFVSILRNSFFVNLYAYVETYVLG